MGILASQVAIGLQSLIELEKAQAQTAAVLKSTGGAARQNGADITRLAEKYEALNATVGDEFIRSAENMILTFTNIKGKAFEPALQAVLNMNTAMGNGPEGLTKTAIQVGKALNDPAKGFTALQRVGVTFTKEQVKRIKGLQEEGKLYQAQKIILAELNKEFGGSFLAQGGTTAGKVAKFTDSINDLQRSLATALLPAIGNVADELSKFLADPAVTRGAAELGVQIGNLFSRDNVGKGIGALREVFQFAKDAAPVVASAAQTMGKVIGTAVSLFKSLPPEIQNLAIAGLAVNKLTGGLVTNIAGGLISSVLKQLVSGVVNVNGAVVNVVGAGTGGIPPVVPGGGGGGIAGLLRLIPAAFIATGIVAAAVPIGEAFAAALPPEWKGPNGAGESESQRRIREAREAMDAAKPPPVTPATVTPTSRDARAGMPEVRQWHYDNGKKITTAVEKLKAAIGPSLSKTPVEVAKVRTATVAAGVAAKNASGTVKTATVAAGLAAKNAGDKTASAALVAGRNAAAGGRVGGAISAAAIRAKKLAVTTHVNVRTNISGREWLAAATQTNIRGGAS